MAPTTDGVRKLALVLVTSHKTRDDQGVSTISPTDREILESVVDRVDPADVAHRMIEAFTEEIAGYARLPGSVIQGQIFEVSKNNVELFFRSIVEMRGPTDEELEPFRQSARSRAEEGLPLEDLLHAYRLGGRLGWRAIVDAATPDEHRALLTAAELLMRYVDSVSSAVAQTYLDERQTLVSEEERRQRTLLDALLLPGSEERALRTLADRVGFRLADVYRPFALALPQAPAHPHSELAASLRSRGVLALTEGDRVAGLADEEAEEATLSQPGALLALGEPTPRPRLTAALDDMRLLVELGIKEGMRGTVEIDTFLPEMLLARSPRVGRRLSRRVLGPLEEYAERRSTDLTETIEAFVECGHDRRATAKRLHVHPNTLDYRLRRIGELTQLDTGSPDDLMLLALALKQRRLPGYL